MGAIKSNIRKLLAAFLCACLLVTYNPAVGSSGTAFADENGVETYSINEDGHLENIQDDLNKDSEATKTYSGSAAAGITDASTTVNVIAVDNALETACGGASTPMVATLAQLRGGVAGTNDVSYIWYEVTGGTRYASGDPYDAQWEVYDNGEKNASTESIKTWLQNNSAITRTPDGNVMKYRIELKAFANATNTQTRFVPGHTYSFVGTFTDAANEPATSTCEVKLYVLSESVNIDPFKWGSIKPDSNNTDLQGVDVEGMRAEGTKLVGGKMLPTDDIVKTMENQVASDSVNDAKTSFILGDVFQLNTDPVQIENPDGLFIPPFASSNMIVRLPIKKDYTVEGGGKYGEDDSIRVLWAGGSANKIEPVNATVVKKGATNGDTVWYAEMVYPFGGEGVDANGWAALPGCFAIEYDIDNLPAGDHPDKGKAKYFSLTVNSADVSAGGTVSPMGKTYWKVGTEQALYTLTPMEGYELKSLTLECPGSYYAFLENYTMNEFPSVGSLSQLRNTLTLWNYDKPFAEGTEWNLKVEFAKTDTSGGGSGTTPENPETRKVTAKAVMQDGSSVPSDGGVVLWYEQDGDLKRNPTGNSPAHDVTADNLPSTMPVDVSIIVPAPVDKEYYKLTDITLEYADKVEKQQLTKNFRVPAVPSGVDVKDITVTVTFVKTSSGFVTEPSLYDVTATVDESSASKGIVKSIVPTKYGDDAVFGSSITFEGIPADAYVDYVEVQLDGSEQVSVIDVNPRMEHNFVWQMPNYHASAHVTGHFSDKNSPSIEIRLTTDGNGSIELLRGGSDEGGILKVRDGQNILFNFVPNDNYELENVTLDGVSRIDDVTNNMWSYTAIDTRETNQKNGLLKLVVAATFKEKAALPIPGPGEPSKTDIPQQVNVYVADESLDDAANPNLAYIFNTQDTGVEADKISVAGYQNTYGVANGKASFFDSVKYGDSYSMTLKGNTLPVGDGTFTAYGIEKVLVVTYGYTTVDGNQTKKGISWDLYDWNLPYFNLTNVTANTDVIVYFAKVRALAPTTNPFDPDNPIDPDPLGPGGGFVEKDFVNVFTVANVANMVTPSNGKTPVLKGGQLPMKFVMESNTYKLEDVTVTQDGESASLMDTLNAAAQAGAKTVSYTLPNIMTDTTVDANYVRKTISSDPVSYEVSAKSTAEFLDEVPVKDPKPCSVALASGANYGSTGYLDDAPIKLGEGSNMRFTLQRDSIFKLKNANFSWNKAGVYAYVVDSTQADGSVMHIVHFTTNSDDLIGKKAYKSGADLYDATTGAPDESTAVWYVENLQCDITLNSQYIKQAYSENPDTPVIPGYDDPSKLDPSDPNHPDNPNNPDNSWTITTKVGKGLGQVFTDSPEFNGSTTRVQKNSVSLANPLTIFLVPDTNFRIKKVHVSASSDDPFIDFWTNVFGWINGKADMLDKMENEAISNGYIKMKKVDQNYEITVDFEPIPEEYDPTGPQADQVAVNVVYDPARGSVTPNEGLTTTKDGKKQFTASPVKVGDKFFSVVGVKVQIDGQEPVTVQAIKKDSNVVRWGSVYYNMFVVDFSQLDWPSTSAMEPNPAVTVEVQFSQTPDTPGNNPDDIVAPGTPDPTKPADPSDPSNPNNPNNPGTTAKQVTVNVVTEGTAEAGSNGIGAMVSPRGTFVVVGDKDADGVSYAEQVKVSPLSGYEVDRIEAVRNGETNDATSYRYMQELTNNANSGKYFTVSAEPGGTEVITIYLRQKPLSERSYTLEVKATGVTGAESFVSPIGEVTLNETASQTISINPSQNVWVQSVTDEYSEDGKNWQKLASGQGVTWARSGSDKNSLPGVTVSPMKMKGKVVDRRVTVTFKTSTGIDHSLADKEKTNIQVQAIGSGAGYVTFDPDENQTGVWKGTDDNPATYNYRYTLSDEAISQGYAIYRVQVNGEDKLLATDVSELVYEGEYAFTTGNFRAGDNSINTLFVYVKQFKDNGGGNGGGSGTGTGDSNDPNNPGTNPNNPLEPIEPDPDNSVTLEYGCGDGGTITLKDVSDASKATGTKGMKSVQVGKEDLFTVVMTPDSKHVMSAVYLNNCIMREFNWVKPSDGRTAKVALEYTLEVDDPDMPARVFAVFKQGSNNTFKPWDAMQIGNNSFATDSKFRVEISPSIGVEALVEMVDDPAVAGDMLSMQEPVAPFTPDVSAAEDDGYVLEYDTISKLSNGKNVRILVGPLIKWNKDDNGSSTLYALDQIEGLQDGYTVTEKPLASRMLASRSSLGADGDGVDEQAVKQRYYTYYEINGKLLDSAVSEQAEEGSGEEGEPETPVVRLNLRELSLDDGLFPEYRIGDIDVPLGSVLVNASVTTTIGSGAITPVAVPGTFGTPWYGNNTTGPWIIPADTEVAFKVEPAEGFVLDSLSVNGDDAARWFDAQTNTLTLTASKYMDIVARFVAEDSADAMRTVTIEVVNAYGSNIPHGSTYPPPGVHPVKKGTPFSITFNPDQTPVRYIPYHIWISGDNIASYEGGLTPEQSSWILPASWNNQTIRVQYAPEGTTQSGANQLVSTFKNLTDQAGASLVRTGDNPWLPVIVLLLLLAGGAAFGAKRFLGASESASRVAKYSVTKREVRRDEDDKE